MNGKQYRIAGEIAKAIDEIMEGTGNTTIARDILTEVADNNDMIAILETVGLMDEEDVDGLIETFFSIVETWE